MANFRKSLSRLCRSAGRILPVFAAVWLLSSGQALSAERAGGPQAAAPAPLEAQEPGSPAAGGGDPFADGFPTTLDSSKFIEAGRRGVPGRIVSIAPVFTETLFALGVGDRVVGVSQYCDHPSEVTTLPRVGSFQAPSVDTVIRLEPDLVLTAPSPVNESAVASIERAGRRIEVVDEGSGSVADIRTTMQRVAQLVGRSLEVKILLERVDSALAEVEREARNRPSVSVAVVVGYDPLVLAGPESYLGDLVSKAGGNNIADVLGGKWPRSDREFLTAADPQVIIDASMQEAHEDETGAITRRWAKYRTLRAVRAGRIYGHGGYLLLRPGPRVAEQALLIKRYLHP